ncbi:MlaD family protein [Geofilum rubicundum]|uniref:ABC-type transport system n=1 Tax=Geofilum rubicundum JCM 15548 TaxID=1236989 RepID=A0A0E9M065_9BACT|nr:MlaD family protein [Geofilum rubicundum]GAO30879.1 ABC-type transport system [Geofilum rubicundum JCM 15548]
MTIKAQKIRLGIFIVFSAAILIFLIAFFTAREIFQKSDTYYVSFKDVSVSGMEVGSSVKYLGIKVGTIADIEINPEDVTSIIVTLTLKQGTPIKEDSKAEITTLGITGLKAIEIRDGTNEAPMLPPGEFIPAGSSITDDITGKAEVIAEKAEQVINNLLRLTHKDNEAKIMALVDQYHTLAQNTDQAVIRIDSMLNENREDVNTTIRSASEVAQSLLVSSEALQQTIHRINTIVDNDTINQIVANVWDVTETIKESNIKQLIDELAMAASQTQQLLIKVDDDINKGSRDLLESQQLINSTLRNLNEASRKINDNPSVLIRGSRTKNLPDNQLKNN